MNSTVSITYYTDPLCCWSWAMQCSISEIKKSFGNRLRWRYCMGGLIPGWKQFTDTANSVSRPIQMGPVWMHAAQVAGVSIDHNIWFRDPPASSYPACIAVNAAALQHKTYASPYFDLLQESCFKHGKNIAKEKELMNVASELQLLFPSFNAGLFNEHLFNGEAKAAFDADLQEIRLARITRFPSIILRADGQSPLLVSGLQSKLDIESLISRMQTGGVPAPKAE